MEKHPLVSQVLISLHSRLRYTMKWLIGFCFLLVSSSASSKCTCGIDDPRDLELIEKKFVVVKGKVLKIEPLSGLNWTYDLATLKVEESWYGGRLDQYLNVYSGYGGTCAYHFEVGESYLLYFYKDFEGEIPSTSICTPSHPLVWTIDVLMQMGPGDKPISRQFDPLPIHINELPPIIDKIEVRVWSNTDLFILISVWSNILLLLYIFRKKIFRRYSFLFK